MSAFRFTSAVALFFLAVGSTCSAFAQATNEEIKSSHDMRTLALPAGESESSVFQRLQQQRLANAVRQNIKLPEGDLDQLKDRPGDLMELLKKSGLRPEYLEAIKQNPALLEKAKDEVNKGHGFPEGDQVRPDELNKAFKDLIRPSHATAEHAPNEPLIPLPNDPTSSGQTSGMPEQGGDAAPKPRARKARSTPAAAEAEPEPETPPGEMSEKIQSWKERLQNLSPQLADSPALQNALQSLAKSVGGEDPKWRKLADAGAGLRDRFSDWGKSAGLERFWPAGHFHMPEAEPNKKIANLVRAIPEKVPSDLHMPGIGSVNAPAGSFLTVLAWLVALVVGTICFRKLWLNVQESKRETRRKQALLNAWPVDPLGVNSREELIRAYEFLALSRLGLEVKSWNHLAIAAGLGNSPDPLRRNAALCLTDAYEHARYAPIEDALPHELIAEARRHLCLLAGVAGA